MPKVTGSEQEISPLSPVVTSAGSHVASGSGTLAPAVTSSGNGPLPATPSIVHLPGDLTRSATPSTSLGLQPPAATPQRSRERYQILGEHGRGGIGRISRAHDRELGRDVAIKELISRGRVTEARFVREALITARLEHPGIVPIHEEGRWPDGTPFYAMKLVAGQPLRDLIAQRTTVDQRIGLLHHVIAVADAIAYAHRRNVVHRDLKPANVIVGDFGETIVVDWGLAKDLTATEESTSSDGPARIHRENDVTATGAILGTPTYMAPAQIRVGQSKSISHLVVSDDDQWICIGTTEGEVLLYSTMTYTPNLLLKAEGAIHVIVFSADKSLIAAISEDGHVYLIDSPVTSAPGHSHWRKLKLAARNARFSPDGEFLAITTNSDGVYFYSLLQQDWKYFPFPNVDIFRGRFSRDGRRFVTVDGSGNLTIFDMNALAALKGTN